MDIHSSRNCCRLCSCSELMKVLPLRAVPVGEHYFDDKAKIQDQRYPIDLYQCNACGAVQTQDDIDSNFLWSGYTYFSGQTKGIIEHFQDFVASFKNSYGLAISTHVFDIGSNDGSLLKAFKAEGCSVYGIDPSDVVAEVAQKSGIDTFVGLFSDTVVSEFPSSCQSADVITAFNVFAHSPDMSGMIRGVKRMLNPEGIFCFEVQYLGDIVQKKLLGTVFHEHMIHYSLTSAKNFLEAYEMKILGFKRNLIQMGSIIFYCAHKDSSYVQDPVVDDLLRHEQINGLVDGNWGGYFSEYIIEQRKRIISLRDNWAANNFQVVGYGAARSGPTLAIQFGLENCLKYVLDDHLSKCGRFGVFESIKVRPTQVLNDERPDVAVILAWIHTKNIVKNNLNYLKTGGRFLALWPDVFEITVDNVDDWLLKFDRAKQ